MKQKTIKGARFNRVWWQGEFRDVEEADVERSAALLKHDRLPCRSVHPEHVTFEALVTGGGRHWCNKCQDFEAVP